MSNVRRTTCRVCSRGSLEPFLDLSPMPLANAFLRTTSDFAAERRFPLLVALCAGCGLVQTPDVVDPELLFRDYVYVSGTSRTMARHLGEYASGLVVRLGLVPDDLVVEIASNDGTLLACFRDAGVRTLGVEPAANVAEIARRKGIETLARFFDETLGRSIVRERGPASLVVANNVLAHVDDPVGFLTGACALVNDAGAVVVEVPWARAMHERLEYDTIYHEHLSYFTVGALLELFGRAGMVITHVEQHAVHGGSLRVQASRRIAGRTHAPEALALARMEAREGLTGIEAWRAFAAEARRSREELPALLRALKREGHAVAAYGAPAKGNTLLNWCGIGTDLVEFTVDRNPLKVGSFTPGMHIPVLPVEELARRGADRALLLAWNLREEVLAQEQAWTARGGRFVLPIPRAEVLA